MFQPRSNETTLLFIIRWAARLASVFSIGFILLFFFSAGPAFSEITWEEAGILLLFPIGLLSGLILSWEEELKGGVLAVASVAVLWLISVVNGTVSGSWSFLALGAPGVLFIIYSALSARAELSRRDDSHPQTN
jgi:hypothetical protein